MTRECFALTKLVEAGQHNLNPGVAASAQSEPLSCLDMTELALLVDSHSYAAKAAGFTILAICRQLALVSGSQQRILDQRIRDGISWSAVEL